MVRDAWLGDGREASFWMAMDNADLWWPLPTTERVDVLGFHSPVPWVAFARADSVTAISQNWTMEKSAHLDGQAMPMLPLRHLSEGLLGSPRVVILDSDHVLDQVLRLASGGAEASTLQVDPPLGRARCFAARHVLRELYQPDQLGYANKWEKLARQQCAAEQVISPNTLRNVFERQLLPRITFVDVEGMFESEKVVEEVRRIDHKDAPTAQLAVLLSRTGPLVLSRDKALRRPKLAPEKDEFPAVLAAWRSAETGEASLEAVVLVGGGGLLVADELLQVIANFTQVALWEIRGLTSAAVVALFMKA